MRGTHLDAVLEREADERVLRADVVQRALLPPALAVRVT